MKNSIITKSLAAMSLVVALFAGRSQAAIYTMPVGSFSVSTHEDGLCENPNGFPVVTVSSSQLTNGLAGFLLSGSESASNWLKILQDAVANGKQVRIYTDDNWAHALCGHITENGYTGGAYKILAIATLP